METPTLAPTILHPKVGEPVDLLLTDFIAKKLNVGRVMTGSIVRISEKQFLIRGESVLRPTASGACRRCRRPLTDEASKAIGFGPDCALALGITNKAFRSWSQVPSKDELERARKLLKFEGWIPRSQVQVLPLGSLLEYETKLRRQREADVHVSERTESALKHDDLEPMKIEVPPGEQLFPHQPIGITFAFRQKRSLNGDEPGLGKTAQAALFAKHAYYALREGGRDEKVLFVTLATLKRNAAREIARWWPGCRVEIIDKRSDNPKRKADIYVVNYDILAERGKKSGELKVSRALRRVMSYGVGVLVVDESHRTKSEDANRTFALLKIGELAEYALLMSGTLVVNRPRELVTQLKIAGLFDRLFPEGETHYRTKYCQAQLRTIFFKDRFGRVRTRRVFDDTGAANLDELHEILGQVMIRRRKHEVLVDKDGNQLLPEKQYAVVSVDLDNRAEYDRYEEAIAAADEGARLGMLSHARELLSVGKARAAAELVRTIVESGQKVVVFASFRASQQQLCELFPDALHILASDSQQVRDEAEQRFNSDPEAKVIVVSTLAGGVGLTLHANGACSNAVLVDLDWTAANLDQAHDRIHRIGQTAESVVIWTMVAEGTIDDKLAEQVAEKRLVTGHILDGTPSIVKEMRMKREVLNEVMERTKARKAA